MALWESLILGYCHRPRWGRQFAALRAEGGIIFLAVFYKYVAPMGLIEFGVRNAECGIGAKSSPKPKVQCPKRERLMVRLTNGAA